MKRRYSSFLRRAPLGETMRSHRAQIKAMIHDPEQLARFEADMPESALPALPKKREIKLPGVDIDAIHRKQPPTPEAEVLRAVTDLLAAHPRVAFAIRQNSGAASYETAQGRLAPVRFYKWIKRPEPMTLPDIWGMLTDFRPFCFEVKRSNWREPHDARELEQSAFIDMIKRAGGIGAFITDAEQVNALLGAA